MARTPDKSIEDTGERMVPAYHKGHIVYAEHIVRYEAARSLVKGKVVLDIASGSGYGTSLLAQSAAHVYGVDLDKDAIRYAKKNYNAKNIEFTEGSGTSIPLDDASVDVVISFETIEHIEDHRAFMAEVKRVLKPDGIFVLSTPNDVEFPESNHYHIHEFERKELKRLVEKYFKNTAEYYQGTWLYNALFTPGKLGEEWEGPITTLQTAPIDADKCIYFYLLCANRPITETIEPLAAIGEHYSERRRQEYDASVRKHIDEQGVIIRHLEDALRDKENRLKEVYASKAWKLIRKARSVQSRANIRRKR